jgi:hypothetical protein
MCAAYGKAAAAAVLLCHIAVSFGSHRIHSCHS